MIDSNGFCVKTDQALVLWEPGDRNKERGQHDNVHSSSSHLENFFLSSFQTLVAEYHSVGETDGWHPKTEGKGDKQRHIYFESSINNILAHILDISPFANS